ncbi:MAG TPA: hypothetical protein VMY06_12390 [Sedimentisphaerales bacterium]|nr:hypothetical protein [Sedimentisphaerales bacterium]
MKTNYAIFLILVMTAVLTVSALPGLAQGTGEEKKDEKKEDIWTDGGPGGPGRGPGRRGPGRFDLTDEDIERIMKSLSQTDPGKVKELEKLRKEDPNEFQSELRKHGREEFGKIIRERMNKWRERRREEFIEWLGKNYRRDAAELAKLKGNTELYWKKYELIRNKYRRIFEEERRNPELADVLKEDLRLRERRDELLHKIKTTKDDKKKKELIAQLQEVIGDRYDLIIRQKQIAYEQLLKRLEDLKRKIRESRDGIAEFRQEKVRKENIKKQTEDLLKEIKKFKWNCKLDVGSCCATANG